MPESLSGGGRPIGGQQVECMVGVWQQQQRRLHTRPPQPLLHRDRRTGRDDDVVPALHQQGRRTAGMDVRNRRQQGVPLGNLLRTAADDPVQSTRQRPPLLNPQPFEIGAQQPPQHR